MRSRAGPSPDIAPQADAEGRSVWAPTLRTASRFARAAARALLGLVLGLAIALGAAARAETPGVADGAEPPAETSALANGAEPPAETSAADRANVEPTESEPAAPIVREIVWQGLEVLDEETLEARIVTTERPTLHLRFWRELPRLDPFVLEDDLDRIREVYAEQGYFGATARFALHDPDRPEAEFDPEIAVRVRIEISVTEGEQTRLREWTLRIAGPETEPEPIEPIERVQAEGLVRVEPGEPFGTALYRERRRALLAWAAEIGFPYAHLEGGARVETESHEASVDWTLHTGPRVRILAIDVSGLDRVQEHVLRRELVVEPLDRYRGSALVISERRLIATGLFDSVVIRPANDARAGTPSEGRLALEVHVEEARPRSLRTSIGYGSEDGPRGEASLDWRNFLGGARLLRLRGFASFLDVGVEGSLGQPWLFGETTRGDLTASALRQDRPGYEAFVTGAAGIVTWKPSREHPFSLSVGPGYELTEISDFKANVDGSVRGPRDATIVNLFTRMRLERVDDPIDPSLGFRTELANELGGSWVGSDLDYHLWTLDLRGYLGLGPFVLATRAAATTLDPIDGGRSDVPLTRRLYSGGTNSIRGFGFQRLGPEDASNDPLGGLSRIEMGTELRIRIRKPLSLVAFVDAGDVRSRPWNFRPTELRASAGPGLRIDTPVGPIRLDAGFLLNPPRDTDAWRIHLSVGHAF